MTTRPDMSLMAECAVCEALTTLAVLGSERSSEGAILALYEFGYTEVAASLDTALSYRRELAAKRDEPAEPAEPSAARMHHPLGRCWCRLYHLPTEAHALNRALSEDGDHSRHADSIADRVREYAPDSTDDWPVIQ